MYLCYVDVFACMTPRIFVCCVCASALKAGAAHTPLTCHSADSAFPKFPLRPSVFVAALASAATEMHVVMLSLKYCIVVGVGN